MKSFALTLEQAQVIAAEGDFVTEAAARLSLTPMQIHGGLRHYGLHDLWRAGWNTKADRGKFLRGRTFKSIEQSLEERLSVTAPGCCWEWSGFRDRQGYGRLSIAGDPEALAHRLFYRLANGPIPDGLMVLHTCDNPPCCNLEHLHGGTQTQNMAEMTERRRSGLRGFANRGRARPDTAERNKQRRRLI